MQLNLLKNNDITGNNLQVRKDVYKNVKDDGDEDYVEIKYNGNNVTDTSLNRCSDNLTPTLSPDFTIQPGETQIGCGISLARICNPSATKTYYYWIKLYNALRFK